MSLCLIMAALPNERPLIVDQTCPPPSADNDEDDDDDDVNDDDDDDDIYNGEVSVCVSAKVIISVFKGFDHFSCL